MIRVNIVETNLFFNRRLTERTETNRIIIHHTGSVKDTDQSAAQIHDYHKNGNSWAGIGYHFVIRKNGAIERGRPVKSVGAHASEHNSDSIGIHLSGQFNLAEPTAAQIESAAMLIANLCADFNIPIDRQHIIGHDECYTSKTDGAGCPGRNLFKMLDTISGKANWYRYNSADVVDKPTKNICPTCGRAFE